MVNNSIGKQYLTDEINCPHDLIHIVDRNLYLLKYLYGNISSYPLECWTSKKDHVNINKKGIVVGLGGNLINKKYPLEKWKKVFKALPSVTFYLLDKDYIDIDLPNCINYTGKLTIRQCISVIKQNILYVGHDTFYVHAASAYNIPQVVLYKENLNRLNYYLKKDYYGYLSSYYRWQPLSKHIALFPKEAIYPCNKKEIIICTCEHNKCISRIKEQDIINAINTLLEEYNQ